METGQQIRTGGRLSLALSIGLAGVVAVPFVVAFIGWARQSGAWQLDLFTAASALNFVAYIALAATIGALIGLMCGSWLSRHYLWIFSAAIGFFAPAVALLCVTIAKPELSLDGSRLLPLLAATGVSGLIFGIVTSRARTGMARRSRRMAIFAALAGAPAGVALFVVAKIAQSLIASSSRTDVSYSQSWPIGTVFVIATTILASTT